MALSIFSNTIGGTSSPQDGFAIGQVVEWSIRIDSVADVTGKTFFFNLAGFIDKDLPYEFTNIFPSGGYSATLSTLGLKVTPEVPNPGSNRTQAYPRVSFTLQTAKRVLIEVDYIFVADTDRFIDNTVQDTVSKYLRNGYNNPNQNDNSYKPTVYNKQRALRGHLVIGDETTGVVDDQIHIDHLVEARWYDSNLTGAAGEYTDWVITLERNSQTVTTLSAFEDTTVKIQVDIGAQTLNVTPQINIFRTDGATNTIDYIQDLQMGHNTGSVTNFGTDYIVSFTTWALVAGTVYESTFLIDHTKIQQGANYQIVPVVQNAGGTLANSFKSDDIPATSLIPATTGTMTGEIIDYNDTYLGNCLVVAPYERIKSCVEVDKASYDAEVITNGTSGDFDTNLKSVEVVVTVLTVGEVLRLDNQTTDPSLEIVDNFNIYKSCLTIRMQPEWASKAVFIDHIYTYEYKGVSNLYEDIVTFRQLLNPDDFEENKAVPDQIITAIRFFDNSNNPVTEICEDFDGPLRVEVEKIATVPDYNLIAALKIDTEGQQPEEEESYTNNLLEQLFSDKILSVDTTFGVDNLADFTIDQNQLQKGVKYRVIAIAKEENATPPPECPVINSDTNTEVTAVSGVNLDTDLDIDFTITNFAPSTVASVVIDTTTDTGGTQNDVFGAVSTGSYTYSFDFSTGFPPPATLTMDITVTLANGCVYEYTATHLITPIVGRKTNDNQDIEAI